MKSKINKIVIACLAFLLVAAPASADFVFCGKRGSEPCTINDLWSLVFLFANFLIGMAGFVALFFVVWGGVRMLLSAGNPASFKDGKDTVRNALLGLVVVFLSYLIVGYVAGLLLPNTSGDPLRNLIDYVL